MDTVSNWESRTILEADRVCFRSVLKDIAVAWQPGQLVGVIGPNGSGKSTLLRLLAGIWTPSQGAVRLSGAPLNSLPHLERARRLAYLPQQMPEGARFTVEAYVEMGRFAHRTSPWGPLTAESRDAVGNALTTLNLEALRHRLLEDLSGGERQRVGVARCLAQGSPVILLDEPISNLDVHYQLDIFSRLKQLALQGHLVVVALHQLELGARFCDTLVLLHQGRLYASGEPDRVLTSETLNVVFQVAAQVYRDPYGDFLRFSHFSLSMEEGEHIPWR